MEAGDQGLIEGDFPTMATFRKEGFTRVEGPSWTAGMDQTGEAVEIAERVWSGEKAHPAGEEAAAEKDPTQGSCGADSSGCGQRLHDLCHGFSLNNPEDTAWVSQMLKHSHCTS